MANVSNHRLVGLRALFLLLAMSLAHMAHGSAVVLVQPSGEPSFEAATAGFGPELTCDGVTGELVEAEGSSSGALGNACTAPASPVTGKIVLVDRGICFLDVKVRNLEDAGALAVIVVNDQSGPAVGMRPSPDGPEVGIPSVMVSKADGAALRALGSGVSVRLRDAPCYPARVVATKLPDGMLQVAGSAAASTDRFVLTNLGDEATSVSLSQSGLFFAFDPSTVELPARASQTFTITAPATTRGMHSGRVVVSGAAVEDGPLDVPVRLAVDDRPTASPGAMPATPRIDVSGTGEALTASATFTNGGSGVVRGLLVGDAPWILTPGEHVDILPGETRSFPFTIDRSLRVEGGEARGSTSALLRLVHLDSTSDGGSPLRSAVSIVDTVTVEPTPAVVPPPGVGEVVIFVPGAGSVTGSVGAFISGLSIVNESRKEAVDDLRVFYGTSATDALMLSSPLQPLQAINYSDVVANAFGQSERIGTLQIRSSSLSQVGVSATAFQKSNASGTYGTALPAFRSDRSLRSFEIATLSGIVKSATTHSNVFIQETSGIPSSWSVEFFDGAGAAIGLVEGDIAAYALSVVGQDRVPEGTASAVVTNRGSGRIAAYATLVDRASGDSWFVADWNRFHGVPYFGRTTLIPVAGALSGRNGTQFATDVAVTNVGGAGAPVTFEYWTTPVGSQISRTIDLAAHETRVIEDVVTTLFETAAPSIGYVIVRPEGGSMTVTSRTYTTAEGGGTFGTGVPVIPFTAALAPGESRAFAGLADSSEATTDAKTGGTYRSNVGLLEVQGGIAFVRVSLFFSDGRPLSAGGVIASRKYTLQPYELLRLNAIASELLGAANREGSHGDLDNLTLRVENGGNGTGWVLPYVTLTDNGTGDTVFRVE